MRPIQNSLDKAVLLSINRKFLGFRAFSGLSLSQQGARSIQRKSYCSGESSKGAYEIAFSEA
jgi:hypothetical protein